MKIILGSGSPRRKELLQSLGYNFQVVSIDCEEIYPENLEVPKIAEYLSELKANSYTELISDEILITADTVVAINNEILGKPKSASEAKEMLQKLSGKTHEVYTAFTLKNAQKLVSKTDVASVEISELSEEEIDFYIKNYQPFDKAGSYGIQEWLGMAKVTKISGSYYTIMGLPTHLLYASLKDFQ
jgi:septum formation protein